MKDHVLIGQGDQLLPLPEEEWRKNMAGAADMIAGRLAFMTEDHHRVRDYAVRELPRHGRPMPPGSIAQALGMPEDRVVSLLDDLEKNMTFLFRNARGEVTWAYPVTCDDTPHQVTFGTGERINAA
ncbi:MAG: hypothetical protein KKB20_00020 [Proteobacteria bacterium]|nr:hypothetical protein [Pseudomonadota bacterium]